MIKDNNNNEVFERAHALYLLRVLEIKITRRQQAHTHEKDV